METQQTQHRLPAMRLALRASYTSTGISGIASRQVLSQCSPKMLGQFPLQPTGGRGVCWGEKRAAAPQRRERQAANPFALAS
jgi:hypothetical protein